MLGEGSRQLPDNITRFKAPKRELKPILTDLPLFDGEPDVSMLVPIPPQTGQVVDFDREVQRRDIENALRNMCKDRGIAFVQEVITKRESGEL